MLPHRSVARAGSAIGLVAALATILGAQGADTTLLRRNAAATFGLPGLVQVPMAAATPSGTFDLTFDDARQPHALGAVVSQRNVFVTVGFFSWLTLGARGTSASNPVDTNKTRDLSASVQVHLLDEHGWAPAIAAGAQDVGGAASHFDSRYLVASKTWLGHSTVSVGYGIGPTVLKGVFGGVGLRLDSWATALGEYDGHGVNAGIRVFPFPSFADGIGLQPRVDVVWRQGVGAAFGVGIRTVIGGHGEALPRPTANVGPARRAAAEPSAKAPGSDAQRSTRTASAAEVEAKLVAHGFENVRAAIGGSASGPVIVVDYENRRFNRDELDALGVVMGVISSNAPDSVKRMRITIRRVDLPVMTIESGVGEFVAFVNDRLSNEAFAAQLTFLAPSRAGAADGSIGKGSNPSRWKLDVFVRPRVENQLLTELGDAHARVTALVDLDMQLGPGLVLNARRGIPVVTTPHFWAPVEENPNADRLLLHQALQVPMGDHWPLATAITQFSAGRFGPGAVGFGNETNVSLADGRVSVGGTIAVFGKSFDKPEYTVALGTARVRFPRWDVTTSLTAGRFFHGDVGVLGEMARQFGATELAFYFKYTDIDPMIGARFSLPLAPARERPPSRVRLRAPDLFTQGSETVVRRPVNELRSDIARLLDTDHEIARVYRTRDRLQPVTVVAHVESLKAAAHRWLGAETKPR
jgi:hypothetical protein